VKSRGAQNAGEAREGRKADAAGGADEDACQVGGRGRSRMCVMGENC